ncbi:MAG: hypothetical protein AAF938_09745 [Myxococcota bacterium]
MNLATRSTLALAIFLIACGSTPDGPSTRTGSRSIPSFDVHEWGVLNLRIDDEIDYGELGAGPGTAAGRSLARQRRPPRIRQSPVTVDKPVVYVHSEERSPFDVTMSVRLTPHLSFAETFPSANSVPAPTVGESIHWQARVQPDRCSTPSPPFPQQTDPACQSTPDGYCEGAELSEYVTPDAACLSVGSATTPLLFYRGSFSYGEFLGAFPSPVHVRRQYENMLPVLHVAGGSDATTIGGFWLVERSESETRISTSPWPERGSEVQNWRPTSPEEAHGALRRDLSAHGLSEAETNVFMETWMNELFAPRASTPTDVDAPRTAHESGANGELPAPLPSDGTARELLFWWPQDTIDLVATLEIAPAPRNVNRALLVRVRISR